MLLFFLIPLLGLSQNQDRKYSGHQVSGDTVFVKTSDGDYRIVYYTPQIVETSFIPTGENFNKKSHAVVLSPAKVMQGIEEDDNTLKIDTEGIDISIIKKPFQVAYYYKDEMVISEKEGFLKGKEHQKLNFNLEDKEMLFGGGARALGMNRRGNRLELYNKAHYGYEDRAELLNYSLPIVISSEKYMLHFDNAPIGFLDLDSSKNNTLTYETISGRKTYQLIVGETWETMVGNYTLLTGRQPMPPRWALGNFSSRFGYHSQKEVLETIQKFKEENIPVDAVILDLFWFGKEMMGTMGNLEFERDSFPDPKKMISRLEDQGVKTILVTEPFILTTSNRWEDAVKKEVLATDKKGKPFTYDFYFGNTGLVDIFKPEARDWFWDIYKDLSEMGISGWWGDLGEPEVHPANLQHVTGSANEMHNIYGHSWAKMIYEGYEQDFPAQRPFILMRAGAAGSQRFGLIPWSGDVNRSWGGLQSQPEISLQMGLQGLAYMHSDLGGFAGDNLDDKLYARWLQYGVFQPLYRPHAQEAVPSEPVFREPQTKRLAKKAIELRYRLLPYNYNLAWENNQSGIPLMRPLFFEEPENGDLFEVTDTYLWGKDFLVSAVMADSLLEKQVYFPGKDNWFDFYSGKKYKGGTTQTITLKEDHIPTFVRGGAFIPMAKPVQTTRDYKGEVVEVHYHYDPEKKKSAGYLYHDDGTTPEAFEKGAYEKINFESAFNGNSLDLKIEKEKGSNVTNEVQLIELIIENLERPVNVVWVNTLRFTSKNFMHNGKLVIPIRFDNNITTVKLEF
ncbi:DUF4968 domain-containing protein [Antarcticibacterium arcticum]|uniref:DUF4968 domain-containing protein n=1 Tax=Antarcticibacterium arcticum TaxID=2585771 RepID=A0A5B8YM82_9FLAO|nr:DUF4968 domain-containing protein [Antarcticibacterium arcticum]